MIVILLRYLYKFLIKMKKILIADDDSLVIDLITFKLKKRGYQVEHASDGELTLSYIIKNQPDLIILDYQLPGISSGEIIKNLRNNTKTANIPIIILSSSWRERDVLDALQSGINDFMTKPFSPDELLLRVELCLKKNPQTQA
jgi:two-component system, OmpR family, alkaline phosphatase synthesis response regulator PhoP